MLESNLRLCNVNIKRRGAEGKKDGLIFRVAPAFEQL